MKQLYVILAILCLMVLDGCLSNNGRQICPQLITSLSSSDDLALSKDIRRRTAAEVHPSLELSLG